MRDITSSVRSAVAKPPAEDPVTTTASGAPMRGSTSSMKSS